MKKTSLCDLLSIEYPIILAPMAWIGTAELAAAVSEAGGLGTIGPNAGMKTQQEAGSDPARQDTAALEAALQRSDYTPVGSIRELQQPSQCTRFQVAVVVEQHDQFGAAVKCYTDSKVGRG